MMSMTRVVLGGRSNRERKSRGREGERRLLAGSILGIVAALGVGLVDPAHARAETVDQSAEQLRRLDIMLMVTSLRCRTTVDDFQADYGDFTQEHLAELNEAARALKDGFVERYGDKGAALALDKISVIMANQYGAGHPWLNCHELRQVAQGLAHSHGRAPLVEAAEELLATERPGAVLALAMK